MNSQRSLLTASLVLIGMTVFAASKVQAEETDYSCCGNKESAIEQACRYLDRGQTCAYQADCTDSYYGACCTHACAKGTENN